LESDFEAPPVCELRPLDLGTPPLRTNQEYFESFSLFMDAAISCWASASTFLIVSVPPPQRSRNYLSPFLTAAKSAKVSSPSPFPAWLLSAPPRTRVPSYPSGEFHALLPRSGENNEVSRCSEPSRHAVSSKVYFLSVASLKPRPIDRRLRFFLASPSRLRPSPRDSFDLMH